MAAEPARRPLADAAAKRTLDAEQRVRAALRELDREGQAVTFAAVAARARVSRVFLYQHADVRSEIEALRAAQDATAPAARLPVRGRASDASLRARLRAALDDSQRQREEIARLREELAIAHGRVRELELDRRARHT
ncbi:MAG: DUF6262 family protein [Solirubrobacteraceae bacterium]|jgi:hypothetical protein